LLHFFFFFKRYELGVFFWYNMFQTEKKKLHDTKLKNVTLH
jgi:hypothetical protein